LLRSINEVNRRLFPMPEAGLLAGWQVPASCRKRISLQRSL